jgi:hypothetical protein
LLWYPAITIPGRIIDLTFQEFVKNVAGIFGCSVSMAILVWGLGTQLPANWPYWLLLAIQITFGIVSYFLLVHILRLQAYQEVKALFHDQWQKRNPLPVDAH